MKKSPTSMNLEATGERKSRFVVVKPEGYKDVVNDGSDSDGSDGFLTDSDDDDYGKGSRIRQRKLKEFQERREKEWRDKWEDPSKLEKFQKTIKRRVKLKKIKKKGMSRKIQKKFRANLKDEGRQMRLLYNYLLYYRRSMENHKDGDIIALNESDKLFKKYEEQMKQHLVHSPHLNVKGYLRKYFENNKIRGEKTPREELEEIVRNKLDMGEKEFFQSLGIFSEMEEVGEYESDEDELPELSGDDGDDDMETVDGGRKKKRKKRKKRKTRKRKTKKRRTRKLKKKFKKRTKRRRVN